MEGIATRQETTRRIRRGYGWGDRERRGGIGWKCSGMDRRGRAGWSGEGTGGKGNQFNM